MIFLYLLCCLLTSVFNVSSFDQDLLCSQKKTKMLSNCLAIPHNMSLFNQERNKNFIDFITKNAKKNVSKELALQAVQSFIDKGGNVNTILPSKQTVGYTVLYEAVKNGNQAIVEALIQFGVQVNPVLTLEPSVLHIAVKCAYVKIVKILIENGADVNVRDKDKMTPLHYACQIDYACQKSQIDIVELFVARDDIFVNAQDNYGVTPIMISLSKKDFSILNLLLQRRQDISLLDYLSHSLFHYNSCIGNIVVVENIAKYVDDLIYYINYQDDLGNTPLHIATFYGFYSLVKKLVELGADCKKKNGYARLDTNCRAGKKIKMDRIGILELVGMLEKHSVPSFSFHRDHPYADMVKVLNAVPYNGYTPLHIACMGGKYKLALYLMGKSDIDARDLNNETPLHHACRKGQFLTILNLISKGADVNVTNSDGNTPLHVLANALRNSMVAERLSLSVDRDFERISKKEKQYKISLLQYLAERGLSDDKDHRISSPDNFDDIMQDLKNKDKEEGRVPLEKEKRSLLYYIIQLFIDKGYNSFACNKLNENAFDKINEMLFSPSDHLNYIQRDQIRDLLLGQKPMNSKNGNSGKTMFHYACGEGNFLRVLDLLNSGADIDLVTSEEKTALHYVCGSFGAKKVSTFIKELTENEWCVFSKYEKKIADSLISQIIERDRQEGKRPIDQDNRSVLQYMIQTLIDANVDVGLLDSKGKTAMHYVCETFREDLIKKEIERNKPHFSEIEKNKILDIFLETETWDAAQFKKNRSNFLSGKIESNFVFEKQGPSPVHMSEDLDPTILMEVSDSHPTSYLDLSRASA